MIWYPPYVPLYSLESSTSRELKKFYPPKNIPFFPLQDEVKKNLTIKREKKKELAQRKLLESERAATAALVEKHSQEMMLLITEKRATYLETEANGDAQQMAGCVLTTFVQWKY